jgi:putative DNA primase/helicase
MLLGEGGTGKGTIVRLICLLIGRVNVTQLRIGEINGRFETSKLIGKLLLNVVEATSDCLNQKGAELLKALSGHDMMDGEKKYIQDAIPFEGIFPIIYTSNEEPVLRLAGDESAWLRRLIPIQFPEKRPAESVMIDDFEEVLFEEEAEGIFAWMIEGARKHWIELSNGKGFSFTDAQKRRADEIVARSKSIITFLFDATEAAGTGDLTVDELYDGYASFCSDKNWTPFPERKFSEIVRPLIMKHYGITQSHDLQRMKPNGKAATVRGYRGIKLKNL